MSNRNTAAKVTLALSADQIHKAVRYFEAAKTGKFAGTKGIHVVYDRVNGASVNDVLRSKGISDVVAFWQSASAAGIVETVPAKGGARVYVAGERPAGTDKAAISAKAAAAEIFGA